MKEPKPLHWNPELTVAENSRQQLPAALERYLAIGDKLLAEEVHPRELHGLRLATKHIRYSVEVFEGLFGPRMQDLLKVLREIQQRLGAISDATATGAWLKRQGLSREPEAVRLAQFLKDRAEKQAGEFAHFWHSHFDNPQQRRRWLLYLERYAGRSRAAGSNSRNRWPPRKTRVLPVAPDAVATEAVDEEARSR